MYFFDFCKRIFEKNNWSVIVYILINILAGGLLLAGLCAVFVLGISAANFGMSFEFSYAFNFVKVFGITLLISLSAYVLSLLVILSPAGEAIVRKKHNCKGIERTDHIGFIENVYREVLEKAKAIDSSLSDTANIYVTESQETTVFALGRNTLAITTGLFDYPEEKIKALMARELGHISQKDTDFLLLLMAGNFTVNTCIWALRIAIYIALVPVFMVGGFWYVSCSVLGAMFSRDSETLLRETGSVLQALKKPVPWIAKKLLAFVKWFGQTLTRLWGKIGMAMMAKTRQEYEYSADEFAFNCGYGEVLYDIILNDNLADQSEGIFKDIVKAYPSSDSRIAKLQELGVEY